MKMPAILWSTLISNSFRERQKLESASLKTIAAFANSRDGGTLLIGVTNDGTPCGLAPDYRSLHKPGKDDADLFLLHLNNIMVASMGKALAANVTMRIHTIDGADVCRVQVRPSGWPVEAKITIDKAGQMVKKTVFYARTSNSIQSFDGDEKVKYISDHWPSR